MHGLCEILSLRFQILYVLPYNRTGVKWFSDEIFSAAVRKFTIPPGKTVNNFNET